MPLDETRFCSMRDIGAMQFAEDWGAFLHVGAWQVESISAGT